MKRLLMVCVVCFYVIGCVSTPSRRAPHAYAPGGPAYVSLDSFCKKYRLHYKFDTLDDIVTLQSADTSLKVLLASDLVYCNGRSFKVSQPPYYRDGVIYVPSSLARLLRATPSSLLPKPHVLYSIKTIVIDPGHGGKDPGATSPRGIKEKNINLKVSNYLAQELRQAGYTVYLTRDRDVYLTLKQRVSFANKYKADLFISVHSNANHSKRVRGIEVYHLSEKYFSDQAKALVASENASLNFDEKSLAQNTKKTLWNLICSENNLLSLELAQTLTSTFKKMGLYVRPSRGAPFYVLKYACVPSVLVEIGYLTNQYEEKMVQKTYYQKQLAQGIALGVRRLDTLYTKLAKRYR